MKLPTRLLRFWEHPLGPPMLIFAVALALRLALILTSLDFPIFRMPVLDMEFHDNWARQIIGGDFWGKEVFFRAPLYPYFLALLYWISGGSIVFARIMQAFIGAGSAVLCYLLVLELFRERRVAILSGLLLATVWTAVYFDVELLLVVLEVFFDLAALLYLVRARDGRIRNFVLAGVFFGLSALTRPNILSVVGLAWLTFLFLKPRLSFRKVLPGLLIFYLVVGTFIIPVSIRNSIIGNDFVPISSQGGLCLYVGNNPESDGVTARLPGARLDWWGGYYDYTTMAEEGAGRKLKPSEVDTYWRDKALEFWRDHPGAAIGLTLYKLHLYTNAVELGNNFDTEYLRLKLPVLTYNPVGLAFILPLGLLGMGLMLKQFRKLSVLYLFTVIYSISVVVFFVCDKFRMPVVPALCIFSAAAIFWIWDQFKSRKWKPMAIALVVLIGLAIYANIPPLGSSRNNNFTQARTTLGKLYFYEGNLEAAEAELQAAYRESSEDPGVLGYLGNLYLFSGNETKAILYFERSLKQNPGNVMVLNNLGRYYTKTGEFDKAYDYFERSIKAYNRESQTYYFYALALSAGGKKDAARVNLRLAIEYLPNFREAYYRLGELALEAGDISEARATYGRLLGVDQRDITGLMGMGQVEMREGRYKEAELQYRRAIELLEARTGVESVLAESYYNLACSLSRQGLYDDAMGALRRAVQLDAPRLAQLAPGDVDLSPLRSRPDFIELVRAK